MTKKHLSLLVVFVMLFTSLFSSFAFAAEEEMVLADDITINVDYHVQTYGDKEASGDGAVFFGTEGESKRLEKFKITLEGAPADMELVANGHVQTYGDMPEDGSFTTDAIGTTAEAKRLEGLGLKLVKKGTDELYPGYSIQYQVHMRWYGWGANADQNWRKGNADAFAADGEYAGTKGEGLRLEGVSIRILKEAKLAVKDVTADNLKTMVVNFNGEVDGDTITATSVKVTKGSGTSVVDDRLLSEDGKTLTIVYTSGAVPQSTELKLTIDGVKSADGTQAIEDYTKTVVVNDVTIPETLDVRALNAKQIEVVFSEPVNISESNFFSVLSQFKLNGVSVIAKVAKDYSSNSVILELSNALEAKTHKLEVKDVTDYATYKALTKEFEFVVVEDKAAPVMINAEMKSVNKIQVTFDEALSSTGSFWVNDQQATANPVANSGGKKYDLTGFPTLDLGAIVQIKVEYQNQTDLVGNKVSTKATYIFSVQDDTSLPTVEVAVSTGNKLTLTFSKPMLENTGTIQILDKDGKPHSAIYKVTTFKNGTNDTVLEIDGSVLNLAQRDAGKYFVNIKGMKDSTVRANLLPEQKIEINTLDAKSPEVVGGYKVTAAAESAKDTITFYFSEAINADTAKNLSNYVNNDTGLAFSAISGVAFNSISADGKSVTITYPSARDLGSTKFTIYALKDLAGNMLVTKNNVAPLAADFGVTRTATAIAGNKVQLTFKTPMASVDPSFIKITDTEGDFAVPVTAEIGGTNNTVVTFTLNRSIGTATEGYNVVIHNETLAKDVYGQGYAAGGNPTIAEFVDEIRPEFVSVAKGGTTSGAFVVKFSEKIKVTTGNSENLKNDLVIRYPDGSLVANDDYTISIKGDELEVTLSSSDKLPAGTNAVTVSLVAERYLEDTSNNKAVPFEAKTVNVDVTKVGE